MSALPATSSGVERRTVVTADVGEATTALAEAYRYQRVKPLDQRPFEMSMTLLSVDDFTIGRVGFGDAVVLESAEAPHFRADVPVHGRAVVRRDDVEPLLLSPHVASVVDPGTLVRSEWEAGCSQWCLMVSRERLETRLEALIGYSLPAPLSVAPAMDLDTAIGMRWRSVLRLFDDELDAPTLFSEHPLAAQHLSAVVVDGLLLGHRHSASSQLLRAAPRASGRAVARAVDLMEDDPGRPWSVVTLAREVHLSVRSLQEGFRREVGVPPMAYLRQVRLQRARLRLAGATSQETTVRTVATDLGMLHLGRFAQVYRDRYGEHPSTTLGRLPS